MNFLKYSSGIKPLSQQKEVFHHFEVEKGIFHIVFNFSGQVFLEDMVNSFYFAKHDAWFIEDIKTDQVTAFLQIKRKEEREIQVDHRLGFKHVIEQFKTLL